MMKSGTFSLANNIRQSYQLIKGNARAVLLTQVVWALAFNLFSPYLTLYMIELGCTNVQVGQVNAIGMLVGTAVAVFAGWITDRLGRRLTNALGDLVCWILACLVWGFSRNFTWFVVAACLNSFVRLSGVAWNCSLNEGTLPEHRVNVYWWLSIVSTLAAFATPLMSLLIRPFGLVTAMRWVLLCSAGLLVVSISIRYKLMRELPVGLERKAASRHESPLAALTNYGHLFRILLASPVLLIYIVMRTLIYVQMGLKGAFLPITVVQGLGFGKEMMGVLNFVSGAVMLLTQLVLLHRLSSLSTRKALAISLAAMAASSLILVFAPANSILLLILCTVLTASGSVVTTMLVETILANTLPDRERAPLLSMVAVLMVAFSTPFMWLGGILSNVPNLGPRLPMALIAVVFAISLLLLWLAGRFKPGNQDPDPQAGDLSEKQTLP